MADICRVLSWNIREFRSSKDEYITDIVASKIKTSRADVVSFQGLGSGVAKRICDVLGPKWAFSEEAVSSPNKVQKDYLAIIYKHGQYLMTASNYIEIDSKKTLVVEFLCASNCVKFWVISVVLPLPSKTGLQLKRDMCSKIPLAIHDFTRNAENVLIVGGFNMPFNLTNYSALRLSGYENAVPSYMSTMQTTCQSYDNIWYKQDSGMAINKVDVLRFDESPFDHCPIMAEFFIRFMTTTNHDDILNAMEQLRLSKENSFSEHAGKTEAKLKKIENGEIRSTRQSHNEKYATGLPRINGQPHPRKIPKMNNKS